MTAPVVVTREKMVEVARGEKHLLEYAAFGMDDDEADPSAYRETQIENARVIGDAKVAKYFPATFTAAGAPLIEMYGAELALEHLMRGNDTGASREWRETFEKADNELFRMSQNKLFIDGETGGRRGPLTPTVVVGGGKFSRSNMTGW